jgi:hypothetical protein
MISIPPGWQYLNILRLGTTEKEFIVVLGILLLKNVRT